MNEHDRRSLVVLAAAVASPWLRRSRPGKAADALLSAALRDLGMTARYRSGRLSIAARRRVVVRLIERGREDLIALSAPLIHPDGSVTFGLKAKVKGWATKAWDWLSALRRAAVMALLGPGPLTDDDEAALAEAEAKQSDFFDSFVDAVDSGDQAPGGVASRAASYADAAWQVAENGRRGRIIRDGGFMVDNDGIGAKTDDIGGTPGNGAVLMERRVTASKNTCATCVDAESLGWQIPGTLPPLGDSECHSQCKCYFEYSFM